jgi:hypothetical protein
MATNNILSWTHFPPPKWSAACRPVNPLNVGVGCILYLPKLPRSRLPSGCAEGDPLCILSGCENLLCEKHCFKGCHLHETGYGHAVIILGIRSSKDGKDIHAKSQNSGRAVRESFLRFAVVSGRFESSLKTELG